MTKQQPHRLHRAQFGFSLVEILVGLLIGMVAVIVIMQVFSLYESNKRTTTGGSNALSEGSIALNTLQRDIRQSGYGFTTLELLGCNLSPPSGGETIALAPVTIIPWNDDAVLPVSDPNTDKLLVIYGNPAGQTEGMSASGVASIYSELKNAQDNGTSAKTTLSRNNWLVSLDDCTTASELKKDFAEAQQANVRTGTLYDLGEAPAIRAYAIRGRKLMVCDYLTSNCSDACEANNPDCNTNWATVSTNIVSLRALYGREKATPAGSPANYVIDTYDQETPDNSCNWAKIGAVQLAIVARGEYEKPDPSDPDKLKNLGEALPASWGGNNTAPIDLSKKPDDTDDSDWVNYRYRLFQTIVPLRNINWMGRPC